VKVYSNPDKINGFTIGSIEGIAYFDNGIVVAQGSGVQVHNPLSISTAGVGDS